MIFFTLFLFVASFLLTTFLAPKPQFEDARPSGLDDLRLPRATEGAAVPLIFGKVRMRGPNTTWYGNFQAIPITQKQKTGLFSSKTVTIGFTYKLMMDLGLCTGPGIRLHQIYIDKDLVFDNPTGLSAEGSFADVDEPELFGGREKGGGFVGRFVFYPGNFTQGRDPSLVASLTPDEVPGYVGTCHVVLRGLEQNASSSFFGFTSGIFGQLEGLNTTVTVGGGTTEGANIGEQNQLRPLSFVLSRYPNTLGAATPIIGEDANPICALYDILTSDWGGLNVNTADIDSQSFIDAAAVVASENNGMSLVVSRGQSGGDLISEVLRQVDGVMYQDPASGLFTLRLIRDDFVIDDLDVFDENNVVTVRNFARTSWEETVNQVRVNFTSRARNYDAGAAFAQDLANINSQQRVRSSNVSFPGCTTSDLASSLATRELAQLSVPLVKATIELNRMGSQLRPGDPFILSWPDYGIDQIIMRATRFNLGEMVNGKIVIDALQDVLSISDTILSAPAESLFVAPVREALEITQPSLLEAPHWVVTHTGQQDIIPPPTSPNDSYVLAYAVQPAPSQIGFSVSLSQDGFTADANIAIDQEPYSPQAKIVNAIDQFDNYDNGLIPSIDIQEANDLSAIDNFAANIRSQGGGLFFLNGEIMNYGGATDNGNGTITLTNVRRALLDSTFESHAALDTLFFLDITYLVEDEYDSSNLLQGRFASFTDIREFSFADASNVDLSLQGRFFRPLPPKNLQVGGVRTEPGIRASVEQEGELTLTWNERSRDDVTIVEDMLTASTTPEADQEYEIDLVSEDELTTHATETGIVGDSNTFTVPVSTPTGDQRLKLYSIRDGLRSLVAETAYLDVITPVNLGSTALDWRILITAPSPTGGSNAYSIAEFDLRATVGGSDTTAGGTASSSSNFGGFNPNSAFDNNNSTFWASSGQGTAWLRYTFASPQEVHEVAIRVRPDGIADAQAPGDFEIQFSTDGGVNWVTSRTITGESNWGAGEERVFQLPRIQEPARYWRLFMVNNNGRNFTSVAEMEMREAIGGPDITAGQTFSSSSNFGSETVDRAFDDNPSNQWTSAQNGPHLNAWIQVDFGAGNQRSINEFTLSSRADAFPDATPREFRLEKSDDGITFTPTILVPDETGWGTPETRTFS